MKRQYTKDRKMERVRKVRANRQLKLSLFQLEKGLKRHLKTLSGKLLKKLTKTKVIQRYK